MASCWRWMRAIRRPCCGRSRRPWWCMGRRRSGGWEWLRVRPTIYWSCSPSCCRDARCRRRRGGWRSPLICQRRGRWRMRPRCCHGWRMRCCTCWRMAPRYRGTLTRRVWRPPWGRRAGLGRGLCSRPWVSKPPDRRRAGCEFGRICRSGRTRHRHHRLALLRCCRRRREPGWRGCWGRGRSNGRVRRITPARQPGHSHHGRRQETRRSCWPRRGQGPERRWATWRRQACGRSGTVEACGSAPTRSTCNAKSTRSWPGSIPTRRSAGEGWSFAKAVRIICVF